MKISVRVNILSISLLAFCFAAQAEAQNSLPRVFRVDPATLAAQKAHPDPMLLARAKEEGDTALRAKPVSIMDKNQTPPSGDKHDYMSMARYWWPNPATPDHLPYIRKDGQTNHEMDGITDDAYLGRTNRNVYDLALAYYLTGDERYAEHATLLLRTWFLNKDTAMNPNLNFAQYIKGVNTGRGAGVLDGRSLMLTVDALGMLEGSKNWTAADEAGMKQWFTGYYNWLETSKGGHDEKAAPNNHGSWFAAYEADIAEYLGRKDDAKTIAIFVRDHRIPSQFDAEGNQKYEMVRTNSFSYSAFNLEALTTLAQIVSNTGIDLYSVKPGILTGLDALLPYDPPLHPWPHQQINAGLYDSICPALVRAVAHTHDPKFADGLKRFKCKPTSEQAIILTTK